MSPANWSFFGQVAIAILAVFGLGSAIARLLLPLAEDVSSAGQAITRWCLLLLTGSPKTDEMLVVALLGLLPTALLLGFGSLGRQWWATHRVIRAQTAARANRPSRRIECLSDRLGLADRIDIVRAVQPYSFCYGLLRPRICLSTGLMRLLSQAELEAVLLHERHHLKSRDPLKILLTRSLGRAFFFLPVVAALGRYYLVAKELAADRAVIREQGQDRWLVSALHKLIVGPPMLNSDPAVAGLASPIETRIDSLLDPDAPERLYVSINTLAASALVLLPILVVTLSPDLAGAGLHAHAAVEGTVSSCFL